MENNQAKKKMSVKNGIIAAAAVAAVVALVLVITLVLVPRNEYLLAEEMLASGQEGKALEAFLELGDYGDSQARAEQLLEKNSALCFALTHVGGTVTYGTYEQDGDTSNGPEPIEWIVVAKEDDRVLALSKHILDAKQYHMYEDKVLWKTASANKWLDLDFAQEAFSTENRAAVESAGLLSGEDLLRLNRGSVAAEATTYAKAAGLTGNAWWLRENDTYNGGMTASVVANDGSTGTAQITEVIGIRPSIWVLTDSALIEENAAAVEEALQTRQGAYESALQLVKMFEYDQAATAFALLGDYLDAPEKYRECLSYGQKQGISASDLAAEMGKSVEKAYSMLEELSDDSMRAKEMAAICESLYPYCGSFTFDVDGQKVTVQSDFVYDSEEYITYWVCTQGEDGVFTAEVDGEDHSFFQDWTAVYGMSATEHSGAMEAKVTFENNGITYVLGEYQKVTADDEGNVTSREDYKQNLTLTGIKSEG